MLASGAPPIGTDMPRNWWVQYLQASFMRLAIWIFWLLASMAVGGMIGAWLSGDEFGISFGIVAGGLIYTCLRILVLRNW